MSETEVARLTALLRDAIKLSKVSNRSVERHLGLSSGYLSRLFAGVMELRVQHILEICGAIGFPPGEFFKAAYPTEDDGPAAQEDPTSAKLRQALERLHPASDLEPPKPAPPAARPVADGKESLQDTDVEKILLSALRKLLIQSSAPGADAPKRP